MENVTQPTDKPKSYVTMLPYFVRGTKRYRVNAFTALPYSKLEIEKMENTDIAIFDIIEILDKKANEQKEKSYGMVTLYCEIGHFVDEQLSKNDRPIKKSDILPGLNTITFWRNAEDETGISEHSPSTYVVRLKTFVQTLRTLGISVYVDIQSEPLDDLSTALEHDIDTSPMIEITHLFIKDLDRESRQAISEQKKFTQKI